MDDIAPEPIAESVETVETPETVEEVQTQVEQVEDTVEALGEALLARMDAIDARLDQLETHQGGGSPPTETPSEGEPSVTLNVGGEPDERPRRDHIWFRKVND